MQPALDFLLTHRETVFPGSPIVFCGIDKRRLGNLTLPSDVTGVLLKREFAPTLNIAVRLHPKTNRIVVVSGASEFDTRLLEQAREDFQPFEHRFAFTYLTALPLPSLLSQLSQLPPNTVVLYLTVFRDGNAQALVPHEVVERVSEVASAPVYGFLDQFLGRGIVGGCLYSIEAQGEKAAQLVGMILAGRKPGELPVVELENSVTVFDWRQLQRWGIHRNRLPPGSEVRFHTPGLWEQHKWRILLAVAIACAALGAIYHRHVAGLKAAQQVHAAFARELILSQENERKRIAAELHDSLGHDLLLINNRLGLLATSAKHPPEVARQLGELSQTALRTIGDVRSISQALRPAALEQVGLTKSIEWIIEQISETSTIRFSTEIDNIDGLLAQGLEINLYRIVQEALNNVIKHAQATKVMIVAKRELWGITVSIFDNGRGFDAEHREAERRRQQRKATLGLVGMAERANLLDGQLEIKSTTGVGTRVTLTVPLS
jgi:signal transduction histidine kinase